MPGMPRPEDIVQQAGARPLPQMVRQLEEFGARGGPAPPPAPAFPLDAAGMAAGGVAGAGAAGAMPPPWSMPHRSPPRSIPQPPEPENPFAGPPNLPPPAEIQQLPPMPASPPGALGRVQQILPQGPTPPPAPPRAMPDFGGQIAWEGPPAPDLDLQRFQQPLAPTPPQVNMPDFGGQATPRPATPDLDALKFGTSPPTPNLRQLNKQAGM